MVNFVFFFFSLVVLLSGASFFVTYSVKLAKKLRISPLIIGATAVAIGTSIPEVAVAINATLVRQGDLVTGNIVGANVANIGLILGLAFLLGKIRVGTKKTQVLARLALLFAGFFTVLLVLFGGISKIWAAVLLLLAISVFCWEIYAGKRGGTREDAPLFSEKKLQIEPLPLILLIIVLSLLAVYLSGQLLVFAALNLAQFFHAQAFTVGLTIVSLGTTLPELTTSLIAAFKREEKLIIGTLVGSIIYNFLLVGGLGGVISYLPAVPFSSLIIMVSLIASLTLLIHFYEGKIVPRFWGFFLLLGYLFFLALSI